VHGEEGGGVDGGGFGTAVEAELARGVVTPGEEAAFGVEGERVAVAGGDGGDGEAFEGGDFVGLVEVAGRSGQPA
jgi:hypothetical protein